MVMPNIENWPQWARARCFPPLLALGLTTAAAPGDQPLACNEIAQRAVVEQSQMNSRNLNFLLFDAAEQGCGDLVARFLAEGASVESRDRFGNTALLIAARSGETAVVEQLLAAGSDLRHRNLAGSTALLRAVTMNRRRTAKILLGTGADVNAANDRGITPLATAAFNGNDRLVKMLLAAGADPGRRDATGKAAIVYAAGKGFAGIVAALRDAGVEVNQRYGNNLTALMWAAGHANDVPEAEGLVTVKLLVEAGARHDLADDRGRTALMTAAERGHAEIVAYLLSIGADAERRDHEGRSAADLAANDAVRESLKTP